MGGRTKLDLFNFESKDTINFYQTIKSVAKILADTPSKPHQNMLSLSKIEKEHGIPRRTLKRYILEYLQCEHELLLSNEFGEPLEVDQLKQTLASLINLNL